MFEENLKTCRRILACLEAVSKHIGPVPSQAFCFWGREDLYHNFPYHGDYWHRPFLKEKVIADGRFDEFETIRQRGCELERRHAGWERGMPDPAREIIQELIAHDWGKYTSGFVTGGGEYYLWWGNSADMVINRHKGVSTK